MSVACASAGDRIKIALEILSSSLVALLSVAVLTVYCRILECIPTLVVGVSKHGLRDLWKRGLGVRVWVKGLV